MNNLILTMFIFVVIIGIALLIMIALTKRSGKTLDQARYRSRWLSITQGAGSTPDSWQLAIIQADKLLDQALRERGVAGETLGERLKNAKPYLSNIDNVWKAHKIRNHIAHDADATVSKRHASEAMKIFKRALTDLGAL